MTDKHRMPKSKFRKIAIITGVVLVVLAVIVRIGFMVAAGNDTAKPDQTKASIIQVEGLKDSLITTTDAKFKLPLTIKRPSDITIQKVKVFVNDKENTAIQRQPIKNPSSYTAFIKSDLKSGLNDVKVAVIGNKIGEDPTTLETKEFKIALKPAEKPAIRISGAKESDGTWQIKDAEESTYELRISTIPDGDKNSAATSLTVNEKEIPPTTRQGWFYHTISSLKDGKNTFTIKAKNEAGETTATLTITKVPKAQQEANNAQQTFNGIVIEAQAACAQYAEIMLGVKDINISYNQSSIKRQNADGTVLLKANIAEDRGFLRSDQPLGIMECTTSADGMRVLHFTSY